MGGVWLGPSIDTYLPLTKSTPTHNTHAPHNTLKQRWLLLLLGLPPADPADAGRVGPLSGHGPTLRPGVFGDRAALHFVRAHRAAAGPGVVVSWLGCLRGWGELGWGRFFWLLLGAGRDGVYR